MGAKKIKVRKKDTDKADEILSVTDRALEWGREHATVLLGTVGGLLLVLVVSWAFGAYSDMKERRAQRELAGLWKQTEALDRKNPAALEEQIGRTKAMVEGHKGTAAAAGAAVTMARLLFDAGRYEEALQWYDRARKDFPKEAGADVVIDYGRLMSLESLGRVDEALAGWAALAEKVDGALKRESLWHQARLAAAKGDREKAAQLYDAALALKGFYPEDGVLRAEKKRL